MHLEYKMTSEDYIALQKDSLKRIDHHKARYNVTTIALAMMVFLFGFIVLHIILPMSLYFYSLYIHSEHIFKLIVVCLAIVPVILMRRYIGKYYGFVTIRKIKANLKNDKGWPRDVTLHLHEAGIHVNSSNNQLNKNTNVTWESIKNIGEDSDHYFLYFEENEAIIIPKRDNSWDEREKQKLQNMLQKYLNISS